MPVPTPPTQTRDGRRGPATLAQILGVLNGTGTGVKARTQRKITDAHHQLQRIPQLNGITKTYVPFDEDGTRYPAESTLVQVRAGDAIRDAHAAWVELIDMVATVDATNATATADIVLDDGTVLAENVPGVTLLFLEKQLQDVATFVAKLPTLDPSETWTPDPATGTYRTAPVESFRMSKQLRWKVLVPPTDHHPAQVEKWAEDLPVGTWTTTRFSGALRPEDVRRLAARVDELIRVVRVARERANAAQVVDLRIGEALMDYALTL